MSAATAIQGQADRIAKGRQTMQAAFTTGDDFWVKVDAASDETYENRVKGSEITAMDTALADMSVFSAGALKAWFTLHNSYFQTDLGLASPFVDTYFGSQGWRVPYEFAQSWFEATGARISSKFVFGKGTLVADAATPASAGMHKFIDGADVGTVETYLPTAGNPATYFESPAMVTTGATNAPGGTGHKLTLTLSDGATTRDVAFTPATYAYGQVVVGQATIAPCTVADATITLATTAQFAKGCDVLITTSTFANAEVVTIGTVTASTLIFTTAVKNSRPADSLVMPLCKNAIYKAGTLDTGMGYSVWAKPDRTIAL
jgi:hypothetical protein